MLQWRLTVPILVAAALLLPAVTGGHVPSILVPAQGPEVPPTTDPVASVHAVDAVLWQWSGATRAYTVPVPTEDWNRVFLTFHSWPNHPGGDPWDRLFMVAIDDAEVLHGTTPRGDFTISEDVTEYASIIRDEATMTIRVSLSSWAGAGLFADVTLDFYNDPATAPAGDQAFDTVVSPFRFAGVNGRGPVTRTTTVTFPADAPSSAVVELFTSGHGADGEFWYQDTRLRDVPRFHILVDGEVVGEVEAMPYVYALLGFDGSELSWTINQHAWWSLHAVLDVVGVHHGVGEIPAYRAVVPDDLLPLLSGERTVEVVRENHNGNWPTSVSFLMDA